LAYAISETLIESGAVRAQIRRLAAEIDRELDGRSVLLVGILKGSVFFLCDLARELSSPVEIDFLQASSYGTETRSSGNVRFLRDLSVDIAGRNVLVVEDIVDTGRTLARIMDLLGTRNPLWLKSCALLRKRIPGGDAIPVDFVGFEIEDRFVVGYGLDYAEAYRNLPYVAVLAETISGKELR
jgi:hypoxanthine phosphoribosyltransferase